MPKIFAPKPGEIGSTIEWQHLYPDGRTLQRTGIVVGRAPALGAGHSREVWVVPAKHLPSDIYPGGVVVAVAKGRGYRPPALPYGALVPAGQAFSDNAASSPTGGLAVTNARASWQARQQAA
jgi:hypothetical protein